MHVLTVNFAHNCTLHTAHIFCTFLHFHFFISDTNETALATLTAQTDILSLYLVNIGLFYLTLVNAVNTETFFAKGGSKGGEELKRSPSPPLPWLFVPLLLRNPLITLSFTDHHCY
ncbi:hypothetical protein F4820DRAFT_294702 [Hypoxylon rubiginosum]|uniref:Uncharacterized protein n=1 Tax=Hypoxylon rubiginosum TaxID=110542 RepID=A0ACB9Z141_9PEZI|nr:hypothetical protein F4820DRAFT_294702 [Hypoxylon rubiginosum]